MSLNDLMYKYFCNLSLGLKFGEFYFGFTGYNMPMIKASKTWNKLTLSPSVILVKHPVCLCLNPSSITCMCRRPFLGSVPVGRARFIDGMTYLNNGTVHLKGRVHG